MSLVAFHKLFIVTAALFCGAFAAWQLNGWAGGEGGWLELMLAVVFGVISAGLVLYLSFLGRFLGRGGED